MESYSKEEIKIDRAMSLAERREVLDDRFPMWQQHTLATHFSKANQLYSHQPFMYIEDTPVTYQEIWQNARVYAKAFLHFGVKRGDRMAILIGNEQAYPSLMMAASMVGAVFIPVNTELRKDELASVLRKSDAKYIFFRETIRDRNIATIISELFHDTEFRQNSILEYYICLSDGYMVPDDRFLDFLDFLSKATSNPDAVLDERWNVAENPDEVAAITYTVESADSLQEINLTHEQILKNAYNICLERAVEDGGVISAASPFYHTFTTIEELLAVSFVGGALAL